MRTPFILTSIFVVAGLGAAGYFHNIIWWYILAGVSPLILIGIYDLVQTRKTILRNYPVLGHMRYLLEAFRPEIGQYFIETDLGGRPFNRRERSVVYQRAKDVRDTVAFGTQRDIKAEGYEWMEHSMFPTHWGTYDPRIKIGSSQCTQPYESALMNISAMSFGSLSKNAVMAMNKGAKWSEFAHNTGEGGISPYHLKYGGDLIWQIGTGYFGCRDAEGNFSEEAFKAESNRPEVKMIELKLSQGAKPGKGGILPAKKNTEEIARIRKVEPHTTIYSPSSHKAFSNPTELMYFIKKLRDLSGGKPTGFKLCVGSKDEFRAICKAIKDTGIYPDFICVDGAEGGTGAAPLEFTDHIGTPLYEGLSFVDNELTKHGLRDEIKLIATGRIITGFDLIKALAIGADLVASARGMMMAIGCIQALICNADSCPTGIATQNKRLMKGLDVEDKSQRIGNYQDGTVKAAVQIAEACGFKSFDDIKRHHILTKWNGEQCTFADMFPYPSGVDVKVSAN